jgi:iron-sulfur cluster assembly protein
VATVEHPNETQEPVPLVSITPVAAAKIKQLLAEEPDGESLVLRVAIQGGGCSGFQYGLGFDSGPAEGDVELELEGVNVVVDPFSAPYLQGSTVDFLNTIQESGFKIENPNAVASCGCGHSFTVAEGEDPDDAAAGCGSGCSH